jgi:putative Holliday junction resolvase
MTAFSPKIAVRIGLTPDGGRRVLAIDYGRKRMGLALSDELELTARPLMIFSRSNRQNDFRRLRQIVRNNAVARIVVGYPLSLGGKAQEMAVEAERFARRLQKELGVEVELLDERLTTWAANQMMSEAKPSRRAGAPLDDIAATILLREYLERMRAEGPAAADRE